jgi:hypothetical protein
MTVAVQNITERDMREAYDKAGLIPTSENADVFLIRAHIAYHSGEKAAQRASVRASRGHSYRVAPYGKHDREDRIVRIVNHYDHRNGVTGWV